ncbi:unnamed protein product [Orchesella dallaii]|uniref:Uncharacterized protein n=1 Tax=Orchesella dallaii TaxID=48710 RepID=A0ABP1Q878_9HEXA
MNSNNNGTFTFTHLKALLPQLPILLIVFAHFQKIYASNCEPGPSGNSGFLRLKADLYRQCTVVLTIIVEDSWVIQEVYIGCFNCAKTALILEELISIDDVLRVTALVSWNDVSFTKIDLDNRWNSVHRYINQLGLERNIQRFKEFENVTDRNGSFCKSGKVFKEDICLYDILLERNNCTNPICRLLLQISFSYQNAIDVDNEFDLLYMVPFGAQYESLKFALIFSTNEKMKGTTILELLSPFQISVWMYVVLAMLFMSALLAKFNSKMFNSTWFWVLSILLEMDGNIKKRIDWNIGHLMCIWLYGSILLRNFYTSQMYSHLTKEPEPTNLPKSINEMFFNTTVTILADQDVAFALACHLITWRRYDIDNTPEKFKEKPEYLKRIRIISAAMNDFFLEFLRSTSISNPIRFFWEILWAQWEVRWGYYFRMSNVSEICCAVPHYWRKELVKRPVCFTGITDFWKAADL